MRLFRLTTLTIVLPLCIYCGLKLRPLLAQSAPDESDITLYASYQFHTLKHPTGLAYSTDGNNTFYLFIADSSNNVIRQFQAPAGGGGNLSTLAGNGTAGYADGAAGSAEFNDPTGLQGGLYSWLYTYSCGTPQRPQKCETWYYYYRLLVADAANFVVRKICLGHPPSSNDCASSQPVTTVAGNHTQGYVDGSSLSAQFSILTGISASGSLYLADTQNNVVRSWNGTSVSTFAGNGSHGLVNAYRTSASFGAPIAMTSDASGNTYVTDADNFVIRKIDMAGNVTTFAGTGQPGYVNGSASQAQFQLTTGIVFNPADNYLYVTDSHNNVIRRIDLAGNVSTYAGTGVAGLINGSLAQAQFSGPTNLVISSGIMYVADTLNNVIRRIDMSAGTVSTYIS